MLCLIPWVLELVSNYLQERVGGWSLGAPSPQGHLQPPSHPSRGGSRSPGKNQRCSAFGASFTERISSSSFLLWCLLSLLTSLFS